MTAAYRILLAARRNEFMKIGQPFRTVDHGAWSHTWTRIAICCLVWGPAIPSTAQQVSVSNAETSVPTTSSHADKVAGVVHFRLESKLLTNFWGRPHSVEAGVVLPPDHDPDQEQLPVCYSIHGFGGSHRVAWRVGPKLREKIRAGTTPRMIYVFLHAHFPLGHHEFADSVNNGPWGSALTTEFLPALEQKFGAVGSAKGRFLTGHSSGGWSSLWLQVAHPDYFNGTWSTAPDPIDFRDFSGVDIYKFKSAYFDPQGEEVPLVRKPDGGWAMTIKGYAQQEAAKKAYGGQFASFDAVFSPRGEDGRPMRLFDRATGVIDPTVAEAWRKYDILSMLKRHWNELSPKLSGKLHIFVGTEDTYRLEGAVILAKSDLHELGSDAEVVVVDGRNHGSLLAPHSELWPSGLVPHIHQAMWQRWQSQDE